MLLASSTFSAATEDPAYSFQSMAADLANQNYKSIEKHFSLYLKKCQVDGANDDTLYLYYGQLSQWKNTDALKKWAISDEKAWIPLTALGWGFIDKGWEYRGTQTIDKVPKDKIKLFEDYLSKAKFFLESAAALDPPDPYPYIELIVVGHTQCWPRYIVKEYFKKALFLSPNNFDALLSMTYYYSPMWCGDDDQMQGFMEDYLEKLPKDSDPRILIAEGYNECWKAHKLSVDYAKKPEVWNPVRAEYENYFLRHPDNLRRHSLYALWAFATGHYQEAKQQFDILGDKWNANPYVWNNKGQFMSAKKKTDEILAQQQKKK